MMRKLMIVLATALPPWLASSGWACDPEHEAGVETVAKVVFVTGDMAETNPGEPVRMKFIAGESGDPHGPVHTMVVRALSSDPGMIGHTAGLAADKDRGWLGISLGPTPESLAAQLGTQGAGALILNVVKDSPADRAGILVHDVIISVGGTALSDSGVARAAELIGSHKPGQTVAIEILREGQQKTVQATLEARPNLGVFEWKFDVQPQAQVEDRIITRGKMMQRGPQGEWVFKDLGDLNGMGDFGKRFKVFMPESGSRSLSVTVNGDKKTIKAESKNEGESILVEQDGDDPIIVRRTDRDGKETANTYENADALRAADAEAADLFEETDRDLVIHLDVDGMGLLKDIDIDVDADFGDWQAKLEGSFHEAHEAYQRAMEEFEEAHRTFLEQWNAEDETAPGDGAANPSEPLNGRWFRRGPALPPLPPMAGFHALGKPRQTFQVQPNGQVEVRVRKGDSELVQLYANESDLAQRDPKAYEKFKELSESDE